MDASDARVSVRRGSARSVAARACSFASSPSRGAGRRAPWRRRRARARVPPRRGHRGLAQTASNTAARRLALLLEASIFSDGARAARSDAARARNGAPRVTDVSGATCAASRAAARRARTAAASARAAASAAEHLRRLRARQRGEPVPPRSRLGAPRRRRCGRPQTRQPAAGAPRHGEHLQVGTASLSRVALHGARLGVLSPASGVARGALTSSSVGASPRCPRRSGKEPRSGLRRRAARRRSPDVYRGRSSAPRGARRRRHHSRGDADRASRARDGRVRAPTRRDSARQRRISASRLRSAPPGPDRPPPESSRRSSVVFADLLASMRQTRRTDAPRRRRRDGLAPRGANGARRRSPRRRRRRSMDRPAAALEGAFPADDASSAFGPSNGHARREAVSRADSRRRGSRQRRRSWPSTRATTTPRRLPARCRAPSPRREWGRGRVGCWRAPVTTAAFSVTFAAAVRGAVRRVLRRARRPPSGRPWRTP